MGSVVSCLNLAQRHPAVSVGSVQAIGSIKLRRDAPGPGFVQDAAVVASVGDSTVVSMPRGRSVLVHVGTLNVPALAHSAQLVHADFPHVQEATRSLRVGDVAGRGCKDQTKATGL